MILSCRCNHRRVERPFRAHRRAARSVKHSRAAPRVRRSTHADAALAARVFGCGSAKCAFRAHSNIGASRVPGGGSRPSPLHAISISNRVFNSVSAASRNDGVAAFRAVTMRRARHRTRSIAPPRQQRAFTCETRGQLRTRARSLPRSSAGGGSHRAQGSARRGSGAPRHHAARPEHRAENARQPRG